MIIKIYKSVLICLIFVASVYSAGGTRSNLTLCSEVMDSAYITVGNNHIGFFPGSIYYEGVDTKELLLDSISGNLFIPEERNEKNEYIIYNTTNTGFINWILIEFRDSTSLSSFLLNNAFIPRAAIYTDESQWEGTCFRATDQWLNYLTHCPAGTVQMLSRDRKPVIIVEIYPAKLKLLSKKMCKE